VPRFCKYTTILTLQETVRVPDISRDKNIQLGAIITEWLLTLWEAYSGRKVNYSVAIKASFGEYYQADTNSGDDSMEPRARGAITLYEASDTDSN